MPDVPRIGLYAEDAYIVGDHVREDLHSHLRPDKTRQSSGESSRIFYTSATKALLYLGIVYGRRLALPTALHPHADVIEVIVLDLPFAVMCPPSAVQ